jgi:hypothetical protein
MLLIRRQVARGKREIHDFVGKLRSLVEEQMETREVVKLLFWPWMKGV